MTIAVTGATGFIGRHVVRWARAADVPLVEVRSPRITSTRGAHPGELAARWAADHEQEHRRLVRALDGVDVVINASGIAAPSSSSVDQLWSGNVLWPLVLARAAAEAGTRRLVQVSSAAVQGRRDPLDESLEHLPFSPYSESKADAESALVAARDDGTAPRELVVYRPTSVHGAGRDVTASLVRLSRVRHLPLSGSGDQVLPVALVDNVAAAAVLLATTPDPPLVALHPWEGMTTASLMEALAADVPRTHLPEGAVRAALAVMRHLGRASAGLTALSRRLDLLYTGQRVEARALVDRGYAPPVGIEGWRSLAVDPRTADGAR